MYELEAVYVLNRRPYQESSLIVDILSLDHGRLSILAKGALRTKSHEKAALLQPFQPLHLSWSGQSALKTLRAVELAGKPSRLSGSSLFCGYYVNELLSRLLRSEEVSTLMFGSYVQTINGLADNANQQALLRMFEFQLLQEIGDLPDFNRDISNNPISPETDYVFHVDQGFAPDEFAFPAALRISGRALISLSEAATFLELDDSLKEESPNCYAELKQLMRVLIDHALGGKPLKSRELFRRMPLS